MIINDLSRIYPLFAFELDRQYKIKERIQNTENYFNDAKQYSSDLPFDFNDWMKPRITDKLFKRLSNNILSLARSINKRTYNEVKNNIFPMIQEFEIEEPDDLMEENLSKITTMAEKSFYGKE